jgi:CheY-like chemotaxis protein
MNRNHPLVPAAGLPALAEGRGRQAWLANKRQELLAPAGALLELSEMVLADASELPAHPELLRDQQQVHSAASRLLAMIDELLGPLDASSADDLPARVRHDLRGPLTEIIGVCELWLEDAGEQPLPRAGAPFERLFEDLDTMLRLARRLSTDLNGILDFGKVASDPEFDLDQLAAGQAEQIRRLVRSLPAAEGGQPTRPRQTGTLLVVEDNPINRDLLVRRLARDGHTVLEAADGRQGLALARDRPIDVVLLDVILPGLNGLQVLEAMKADPRLRHVPVIMISAFHELDSVVRCLELGAEDYLLKPPNPVLLRARIDGCLAKKRFR